jgi:hypothetical protein
MGTSVAQMPSSTAGDILKKAALAGAAGGISVAAAGGDEKDIKDGFLKSGGAVLIQGGTEKLTAFGSSSLSGELPTFHGGKSIENTRQIRSVPSFSCETFFLGAVTLHHAVFPMRYAS